MLLNCGVGEDSWRRSPLGCKEIKPVYPKGNQSWIFIGRTDVEAEAPTLSPLDAKRQLIKKDPDARRVWRQEEEGMTEGEMVGWHHQLDGHEFEQALGAGDGQGSLACSSPRGGRRVSTLSDWTELNWRTVIMKSVPDSIQPSKDLAHQIPWSTECLTLPWTPSGGVEGQQLQQHRVQPLQRQMANALVVWSLAMLLASASL